MLLLMLVTVAALMFVAAVAGVGLIVWAQWRQSLYRRRLLVAPMHQHGGRPCYGAACAPVREEAA